MFGEMRAARYQRTVKDESRLDLRESEDLNRELQEFLCHRDRFIESLSDPYGEMSLDMGPISNTYWEDFRRKIRSGEGPRNCYTNLEYEMGLRSYDPFLQDFIDDPEGYL